MERDGSSASFGEVNCLPSDVDRFAKRLDGLSKASLVLADIGAGLS